MKVVSRRPTGPISATQPCPPSEAVAPPQACPKGAVRIILQSSDGSETTQRSLE